MQLNIPNQITLGRLVLAVIFFTLLSVFSADRIEQERWLLSICFWVFLVAALSDVLDGVLARAWQQVTVFGRVVDPVVDKALVCGAFLFFASHHFYLHTPAGGVNLTFIEPWMVVLILLRELLVSALRAEAESDGFEFAAAWAGKLKMFVQSATICVILGYLAWQLDHLAWLARTCVWITVGITALSTVVYIRKARAFLSRQQGSAPPIQRAAPVETQAQVKGISV